MMRGVVNKVSYLAVLFTMVLYVGLRIVPHHHCDAHSVPSIHMGYGACDCSCPHSCCGDSDERNQEQDCGHCCGDAEFCRAAEDDAPLYKRMAPDNTLFAIPVENAFISLSEFATYYSLEGITRVPDAFFFFHALRAPPVA